MHSGGDKKLILSKNCIFLKSNIQWYYKTPFVCSEQDDQSTFHPHTYRQAIHADDSVHPVLSLVITE